jgi:hypothetical protein
MWKRPPCITGASRGQLLTPFYGSNVEEETAWLSQITQI